MMIRIGIVMLFPSRNANHIFCEQLHLHRNSVE